MCKCSRRDNILYKLNVDHHEKNIKIYLPYKCRLIDSRRNSNKFDY